MLSGVGAVEEAGAEDRAGYRRSARSARGLARREQLHERVTDDLAQNGLADFSLRRAARSAGTTHKVPLYHFGGADHLMLHAVLRRRERRIDRGLAAAAGGAGRTLADRVRTLWPV